MKYVTVKYVCINSLIATIMIVVNNNKNPMMDIISTIWICEVLCRNHGYCRDLYLQSSYCVDRCTLSTVRTNYYVDICPLKDRQVRFGAM